jgi:outer membrane biogenesis lipoprotein LolB
MRLALLALALLFAGCMTSEQQQVHDQIWGKPSDWPVTHYEVCHHVNHGFGSCRTY